MTTKEEKMREEKILNDFGKMVDKRLEDCKQELRKPLLVMEKEKESWKKEYPIKCYKGEAKRELIEFIEDLLASQLEEVVELSDRIELEGNTTFEEWKAFKRFRNLLRKRKELKGVR